MNSVVVVGQVWRTQKYIHIFLGKKKNVNLISIRTEKCTEV